MTEPLDTKYIQRRGKSWRVRLPGALLPERHLGTYDTLEEAQGARDLYLTNVGDRPEIEGLTNDDRLYDTGELWSMAEAVQERTQRQTQDRLEQCVTIPKAGEPFAVAYLSDLHIGDPGVDYRALKRDAEIIHDTPRLWCGYHGDGINNWIVEKLAGLQRGEVLPFDAEVQLFASWLKMVSGSLLWVVSGNHDNWTRKLAGFDVIRSLLRGVRVLYDPNEIVFTLVWGKRRIRYKVRHKWRYSSVFNATHGIEASWQRGGHDFDIGLGGHSHIGTACRPFWRHGKERQAVLTGTYKILDVPGNYGDEMGLPGSMRRGCGAHVFWQDQMLFCPELEVAAKFLEFLSA